MWIKNTSGKKDAMLTFAAFSFLIVTLNVFLSTFDTITIGTTTLVFKALDSSIMAVYLGSTFTAYISRRWTDVKYGAVPQTENISAVGSAVEQVVETVVEEITHSDSLPTDVALSQIEMEGMEQTPAPKKRRSKKE